MQCPVCSNELEPQSAFCKHCGTPIVTAGPTAGSAASSSAGYTAVPPSAGYASVPGSAGPGSAVPGSSIPGSAAYPPPPVTGSPGISNSAASAIAYLTIIPAIIFLVLDPYNRVPLIRFHSWQSIALNVAALVIHIILVMVGLMLHFIPLMGLLLFPIHMLVSLAFFVAWLIALLKASKGEWYKLPIIGDFADRQARR